MKNWNTIFPHLLVAGTAALLTACASTTRPGLDGSDRSQLLLIPETKILKDASSFYTQRNQEAARAKTLVTSGNEYDRLARVMNRIVPHADTLRPGTAQWNWELVLIDSPEINANVLPGGKITFYTGIIRKLSLTDDEIAAVMGHEIAHALREHAREKISQNQVATLAGTVIVKTLGGGGELVGMAQKLGLELPFSRAMESEADAYGLELAARAGYHPQGAITLWQKMSAQRSGAATPELLSTHPADETRQERLAALQTQALPLYEAARSKIATARANDTPTHSSPPGDASAQVTNLVGRTFPFGQLPYEEFGFDAFDEKVDKYSFSQMTEGKLVVFPTHAKKTRYVVLATHTKDDRLIVTDVRRVAASVAKLEFVASSDDGGDGGTACSLNKKPVKQVFGYAKRVKKNTYAGQPAQDGESLWIVEPGGTKVAALTRGEKLECKDWYF